MSSFSDGFNLLVCAGDDERGPALLRAAVDLFLAKDAHSDDEVRLFGELCINLQADCPLDCRRDVAEKLARRGDAPRDLICALALAPVEVSEPIILLSPVLEEIDLLRIVARGGDARRLVAMRPSNPETVIRALKLAGETVDAPARHPSRAERREPAADMDSPSAARGGKSGPAADPSIGGVDARAGALLDLDGTDRTRAINELQHVFLADRLRRHTTPAATPNHGNGVELGTNLLSAAVSGRHRALETRLSEYSKLDGDLSHRIVADPGGELFAIALLALGVPDKQAISLFIHVNDAVGRSVERVEALAAFYKTVPPDLAFRIVENWRQCPDRERQRPATMEATPQRRRQPQRITIRALAPSVDGEGKKPLFNIHDLRK